MASYFAEKKILISKYNKFFLFLKSKKLWPLVRLLDGDIYVLDRKLKLFGVY
jgi:hypothetical protein